MDPWIKALGVVGYLCLSSLAVFWASIGVAYIKAGRNRVTWGFFIVSMIALAMLFGGLVFISMEPSWINRNYSSISQRSVALVAAATGWIYTVATLADTASQQRKDRTDVGNSDSSVA